MEREKREVEARRKREDEERQEEARKQKEKWKVNSVTTLLITTDFSMLSITQNI